MFLENEYIHYIGIFGSILHMIVSAESRKHRKQEKSPSDKAFARTMKIAICPPELLILQKVINGEPADATHIIQGYITEGLKSRGHALNFLSLYNLEEVVFTSDPKNLKPALRTWSESLWFEIASKMVWRLQLLLRIPYLNLFSNYRLLDACLQCLPGHDLVYERNSLYRFGIAMACKRLRIPYVLYFEADDILEHDIMHTPINGLLRWRARKAIRYNLKVANCVICVSEPLKAHLVKKWRVPAEKIVVFSNVADVERFKPDLDARKEVRDLFGIDIAPVIIFVGSFYEWHDVASLLRAFVRVLEMHPDSRLILVGDGTTRPAMAQLAVGLGIDHSVIFTGMVAHTDVPKFMAAADIAVVPYPVLNQDIWLSPLKLFEYMASGNAIVASNVGQLSEWIVNKRNGLLVPPGDVSALAEAIEQMIDDPALRLRLGQHGRDDAVQKHSWDHYLLSLEHLFFSLIINENDL